MARPQTKTFSDQELTQIKTLTGYGLTMKQIAAYMGLQSRTFERRISKTPGGKEALQEGRVVANTSVIQTAYNMARSGKHPVMTIFWLKCRANWTEYGNKDDDAGEDRVYDTRWGGEDSSAKHTDIDNADASAEKDS